MKILSIIVGIIILICIVLGIWFFISQRQTSPSYLQNNLGSSFPIPTQTSNNSSSSSQQASSTQEVTQAFSQQTNISDPTLTAGTAIVVFPYALQPWSTTNGGGAALLQYDSVKGWVLISGGGGVWDVPSLVTTGVPQTIAIQLITALKQGK